MARNRSVRNNREGISRIKSILLSPKESFLSGYESYFRHQSRDYKFLVSLITLLVAAIGWFALRALNQETQTLGHRRMAALARIMTAATEIHELNADLATCINATVEGDVRAQIGRAHV